MKGEERKHISENVIEEQRQILPSQKNVIFRKCEALGTQRLHKALVISRLAECSTSLSCISTTYHRDHSLKVSSCLLSHLCLPSILPGRSYDYNFSIVIYYQPQSPWLFLLIIYQQTYGLLAGIILRALQILTNLILITIL